MPGNPGETRLALTFSLNRVDRADRTTPRSNVSVTNETVAARRLFPASTINSDGREKTFCVIDLRSTGSRPVVAPIRARPPNRRRNAQRLRRKLLHRVEEGGERLIVGARHAKKHAGRARYDASVCFRPIDLRRSSRRRQKRSDVISQCWVAPSAATRRCRSRWRCGRPR
jgi:hypothetical protein